MFVGREFVTVSFVTFDTERFVRNRPGSGKEKT